MLGMTVCTAQVFTKQLYYEVDGPDQELYCCKQTESKRVAGAMSALCIIAK